mmetsp:Transcript_25687/g.41060  ORF Transcript_25687/g.41060 Transcript_25687/m.41060 type:complete len:244 (-) Transcript_25687:296-1027(-)
MRRALCCTTRLAPSAYLHLHRRLPGPNASSHPQGRSARRVAHAARDTASRMAASGKDGSCYTFGPIRVPSTQVFIETALSFGLVNLKPVVPGHVLIVSRRVVPRFSDLTSEETADIWNLAKRVGAVIEPHFGATAGTYAIQDGAAAGQTVPHVHVHVLPRRSGDFPNSDDVYEKIEQSGELPGERNGEDRGGRKGGEDEYGNGGGDGTATGAAGKKLDLDAERVIRTAAEMAAEAVVLAGLFK